MWDLAVLGFAALCIATCIINVADPTPENELMPTWYLVTSYLVCMGPMILISAYLVADRRLLRRLIPWLAQFTVRRETIVGIYLLLLFFALGIIVTVIATVVS